jgi:hypothetical protein
MTRKRTKTGTTPEFLAARTPVLAALTCLTLISILTCPVFAGNAPAPQHHAFIFGSVWGPDERPLAGMEVKVRRADDRKKKARWTMYSNRRGEFEVAVPAGKADYVIWAVTRHYKLPDGKHLQDTPEVAVHVENDERADTGLHLK